jgi:hypothetical protein
LLPRLLVTMGKLWWKCLIKRVTDVVQFHNKQPSYP